ncbi:single-stranded telomeric DNA-binding/mRNA-binding protein CYBJADRAFT_129626, partial [Cyberlindnera jadinii NRRL Y-1542]
RGRGGRGGRGGYRRERSPRRPYNDFEDLKDRTAPVGSRESDRNFSNSVFVGNLGFDVDSQRLRDVFGGVGDVIRADVITQRGRHRGMATVEFATREDADRAIDKLHQTKIGDREIFVRHDNPPPESDRERERKPKFAGPHYEVFVGNLPFSVRWQDLKDLFKEAGNVIRADIKMDDYTHRSRGFGMVYFDNQDDVKAAIERFNGYEMEGRAIDVREGKINSDSAAPTHLERDEAPVAANRNSDFTQGVEGDGEPSSIIYVDNLPFATSNQDLIDLFGTIDTVSKAEVKYNEVGRAAGAGVVEYVNEPSAAAAIESLNGYNYGGRDLKVTYAKRP